MTFAVLPQDVSIGCTGISVAPNGQLASDNEIIPLSHETFESITDPLPFTNTAWGGAAEIGDNCAWDLGPTQANGSNVQLNGASFVVQEIWSNASSACVLAFGPTIETNVTTGSDDLRGDSSATATFQTGSTSQTVTLKAQTDAGWPQGSSNVRVFDGSEFVATSGSGNLGGVSVTLTSHNSGTETSDNWNVQSMDIKLLNYNGGLICEQSMSGNPLARLTGSAPTQSFPTPNCGPPPAPNSITEMRISIGTGNDDARSDTELWATLSGEPAMCLKPSNNAESDGVCNNGGSATDQNGNQSWSNWSTSTQQFPLKTPQLLAALSQLTIQLLEHNSGFETDDNWDIQSIQVFLIDTQGNSTQVLGLSNARDPNNSNNCLARLTGSNGSVTFTLNANNPFGSNPNLSPGSCPQ